jgi:uncharacterized membrane protein
MRTFGWVTLVVLSVGVALYAGLGYGLAPLGALVHPDMREGFVAHPAGVYSHVFAALFALLLGPTQFLPRLRRNHVGVHRWTGRLYLGVGVLIGGLSALYISQFAFGGSVARVGFATLALAWLYTGLQAFLAIRRRAISDHRKWMVRNFSLSLAAVTLRIHLPLSVLADVEFSTAYAAIAWLCWIPNLIVAEWRLNSTRSNIPRGAAPVGS